MNQKSHLFIASAIAIAIILPTTVDGAVNSFGEPVGIVTSKTDDPSVSFIGFVTGQKNNEIENRPDAQGFNTVTDLQLAFKQFLIANNIQVVVGEHGYGVKRLLDSMLGNQIIDIELRQQIETVDLVGKLQAGNQSFNTLDSYAVANGLKLPQPQLITDRVARIADVYTDNLKRLDQVGVAPTQANVMPYKHPAVREVA